MNTERSSREDQPAQVGGAEPEPEPDPEQLDPQARSLVVTGPIGFQGKGLPHRERKRIFEPDSRSNEGNGWR